MLIFWCSSKWVSLKRIPSAPSFAVTFPFSAVFPKRRSRPFCSMILAWLIRMFAVSGIGVLKFRFNHGCPISGKGLVTPRDKVLSYPSLISSRHPLTSPAGGLKRAFSFTWCKFSSSFQDLTSFNSAMCWCGQPGLQVKLGCRTQLHSPALLHLQFALYPPKKL